MEETVINSLIEARELAYVSKYSPISTFEKLFSKMF